MELVIIYCWICNISYSTVYIFIISDIVAGQTTSEYTTPRINNVDEEDGPIDNTGFDDWDKPKTASEKMVQEQPKIDTEAPVKNKAPKIKCIFKYIYLVKKMEKTEWDRWLEGDEAEFQDEEDEEEDETETPHNTPLPPVVPSIEQHKMDTIPPMTPMRDDEDMVQVHPVIESILNYIFRR